MPPEKRAAALPHAQLLAALPSLADILRGSLLERHTFHPSAVNCATCASGKGHLQWVLNVNYPGGKNRQITLHPSQLDQVRRQIANLDRIRETLEQLCEANQRQLRVQREELRRASDD